MSGKLVDKRLISDTKVVIQLPKSKQIYIAKLISAAGEILEIKKL
ncbi:hypothetical protein [Putridiphycobacter roseus]|nr:hypothetical protein [Putridiphycobacter roseus]